LQRRAFFTGIIGAMEGIGFIVGPLLGGVLTTRLSWRWCFWINLPVGAITAIVIGFFFRPPQQQPTPLAPKRTFTQDLKEFDWLGTFTCVPSILCLLLALQWGGSKYQWHDFRIILLFVLFGLLLIAFTAVQRFSKATATISSRIARSRSILFGASFAFSLSAALAIFSYYLPLWFQGIKNASAEASGVMLLPVILGMIVGSIVAGSIVTYIGYYLPFMVLSGILTPIAAGLFTSLSVNSPKSVWIGYSALAGFGAGLGFQQPILAAQTVLDQDDVAMGTSIMIFAQTLAGAIFVSVGNTIFLNSLIQNLKEVPQINPDLVLEIGATNLRAAIPAQLLDAVLKAYNKAITRTFYAAVAMSALAFVLSFGMELKSTKKVARAREERNESVEMLRQATDRTNHSIPSLSTEHTNEHGYESAM
jgi:MFS family permease